MTAAQEWEVPSYVEVEAFVEEEVELAGAGGTISLPRDHAGTPGVVLLSGGGPFDRDETVGPNKPLKDLAWGLASRGIAVARFDKLTPGLTMTEQYLPSATAAIDALGKHCDPARIFLVGHSMGGRVAPEIARRNPSVAGLVLLAADTRPLHEAAVRVGRHLAAMDPETYQPLLAVFEQQAAAVADPALSPETPAEQLLFGFPAAFWLELREHDPVATASALHLPMLILQGGRDYQVTVEHDLADWRRALEDRATIRVHDKDDHLFFPGDHSSTPSDYTKPQHVDPVVVDEIADWIRSGPPAPRSPAGGRAAARS
ncbi:alpha/beta hydrolase family protein [Kribbella lupini]|uniref:Serine aminopeptidase S33 domain-containing protein n=1 Tax=Kribbella lupini TaxID=291602 RepID=A0ABN2BTX1_9ACTN